MEKALDGPQHYKPKRPQYDPHLWTVPDYEKRLQMAPYHDEGNLIDNKGTNIIQFIVFTI